jgi:hypothetical protein
MSTNTSSSCCAVLQNTASSYIIPASRFCTDRHHQQQQFVSGMQVMKGSIMLAGSGQGRSVRCNDTSTQGCPLLLPHTSPAMHWFAGPTALKPAAPPTCLAGSMYTMKRPVRAPPTRAMPRLVPRPASWYAQALRSGYRTAESVTAREHALRMIAIYRGWCCLVYGWLHDDVQGAHANIRC